MTPDEGGFDQPIPGYEVMEHLGSGGTGSVYKARQEALGRIVALKVLRRDRAERATTLQRMAKEARLLARLEHPNIVRSIDFGQTGNLMYFTMEFVDGRSARDLLEDRGAFPIPEALHIAEQVARALQHAADRGVVHRDVKPGNVLLGKDGTVKLSDFGLARGQLDRSLTRDGTTVGTPQYMAPEQVKHARRADLRSDFYSLGATLYHLVTGQAPFEGESVAEVLHQVLYGQPIPPESLRPEIPPSLSRVLARLLARNPARRYADADGLCRDLAQVRRQWEQEGGLDDPDVGLSWQEARQAPRVWQTRSGWWLGAAGLVLLGALGALSLRGGEEGTSTEERQRQEQQLVARMAEQFQAREASALEVLGKLAALRKDGTLGSASALERQDLQDRAARRVREEVELLVAMALQDAEREVGAGRLDRADQTLTDAMQEALREAFGEAAERPDTGASFDLDAEVDVAWNRAQARLTEVRGAVMDQVQRALRDLELDYGRQLHLGDAQGPGLLEAGRMGEGLALLERWPAARDEALRAGFLEGVRAARLPLPEDRSLPHLLEDLPEAFVSDFRADRAGQRLRSDWNDAVREVQQQLIQVVDERAEAHRRRILGGEFAREPEDWTAELERDLEERGLHREGLPREPNDWLPAVERHEASVRAALSEARAEERRRRLTRLVEGTADQKGLRDWLVERDFEGALRWVEAQEPGMVEEAVAEWRGALSDVLAYLRRVEDGLRARHGQKVELLDNRGGGILHSGTLEYPGPDGSLKIGRSQLALTDLSRSSLEELAGGPPATPLGGVVLALAWQRTEEDLAELGGQLATTPAGPARDFLVAEVKARQDQARLGAEALEAEVQGLFDRLVRGLEEGRYDEAEEALKRLRSSRRHRETSAWKARRSELPGLAARLAERQVVKGRMDLLSQRYAHADQLELAQDGQVTLRYEFEKVEQGLDLDLGGAAARVEGGALLLPQPETMDRAKVWGPSLPLPVDPRRPFTLTVDLFSPFEQPAVTKFVGLRAGPVCVGLFRPELGYPGQCAVWIGTLDGYAVHFFDASLGLTEPEEGPTITGVALERAQQHTLVLRYRAEPGPAFELSLDGTLVHKGTWKSVEAPPDSPWEVRSAGALQVRRMLFEGYLEPEG